MLKLSRHGEFVNMELCNTVYARGKCTKMRTKKEFLYTICAEAKNLDFPGRIELVDTITRAWGNHQKLTKTYTKKRRIKPNKKEV